MAMTPLPSLGQNAGRETAQKADSTIWLPEIVVAESRIPVDTRESTARVTTVIPGDMPFFADDLGKTLRTGAGLHVRDYGPAGLSTLGMRGGSASHIGVVYDGIPLHNAQLGEFDLSLLGMDGVGSVQVIHGSGSSWLGGQAASGLVVINPDRAGTSGLTIKASTGSFGEFSTAVNSTIKSNELSANLAYRFRTSDGDFPFVDNTLFPVQTVKRKNASRESHEVLVVASLGNNLTHLGIAVVNARRGLPGSVGLATSGAEQYDTNVRIWASQTQTRQQIRFKTNVAYQSYRLRYINPGLNQDDTGHATTVSLEESVSWTPGRIQLITGGLINHSKAVHPALQQAPAETGGAIYSSVELQSDRVNWSGSVRYDRTAPWQSGAMHDLNPRTGINVKLDPSENVRVKASVGTSSTVPTFNDRFWSGMGASGNTNLKPETGWDGDVGLFAGNDLWTAEVTGFLNNMKDRIEWAPDERAVWTPSNIGKVHSRGIETSFSISPNFGRMAVQLNAFHTITRSVDRTDAGSTTYNKQLRYIPVQSGAYSVKVASGNNMMALTGEITSRRFITADEQASLRGYVILDFEYERVLHLWGEHVSLAVGIENLMNERYNLVAGYPMPGRQYHFGMSVTL